MLGKNETKPIRMVNMKLLSCLVIIFIITNQLQLTVTEDVQDNEIIVDDDQSANVLMNAASELLKNQDAENLGGMIGDFMQSDGGKQLGDMLMSGLMNNGDTSKKVLKGLGAMLNTKDGKGLDPSLLSTVLSSLSSMQKSDGGQQGFDVESIMGVLQNSGFGLSDILHYAPMLMQTFESFVGPEATEREKEHAEHAWMLPPGLEKLHVLFDHFLHSDVGKAFITNVGAEKFIKVFRDENGKLSYGKFVDLLENHSFRRHWIHMITSRILDFIAYFADPYTQKKFVSTVNFFVNSFLKSQGFPKAALFDPNRPTESLNSLLNHLSKKFFSLKYDYKPYVKPIVTYIKEIIKLAEEKGLIGRAINSQALSHKLTDTINLDIIEPIARVNRAYRFILKHPKCDLYVMCLINRENPSDEVRLPALKKLLYRSTSLLVSWLVSNETGTSFLKLYSMVIDEDNCELRYLEECNDFHVEEIKVTTEYVHTEL